MRTRTDRLGPTTRILLRVAFLGATTGALLLLAPAAANALETDADPASVAPISTALDTVGHVANDTLGDVVDDTVADVNDTVGDVVDDVAADLGDPVEAPTPGGDDPPPADPDSPEHPPAGEEGSGSGQVNDPGPGAHPAGGAFGSERPAPDAATSARESVGVATAPDGDTGSADPLDPFRPPLAPAPGGSGYGDPLTSFPIGLAALAIGVLVLLHAAILWLRMTDDRGPTDPFLITGDRPG